MTDNFHKKSDGGSGTPPSPPPSLFKSLFWRPNNYRVEASFMVVSTGNRRHPPYPWTGNGIVTAPGGDKNRKNYLVIKNYLGATIIKGKSVIQAVYPQKMVHGYKEVFKVNYRTKDELSEWILSKRSEIKAVLDNAVINACRELGLRLTSSIKWGRYEDWTKLDIPARFNGEGVVHCDAFKRVYDEGVEFVDCDDYPDPGDHLIESVPEFSDSELGGVLREVSSAVYAVNPLRALKQKVRCVDDVFLCRGFVEVLSAAERRQFEEWVFKKLGVAP